MMASEVEAEAEAETKACPFCAEEIKAAAIKCKHCQSDLRDDAEKPEPARAAMFNCLVCRTRYDASDDNCPQCGALKGQNFVMAPGQAPPQSSSPSDSKGPPAWMWWAVGLTMLGISAALIGILASTKIGLAVVAVVVLLIYFAL